MNQTGSMPGRSPSRRARDQRGAAMVEAALVGLTFFLFMFGIMEFGRAVWMYNWVSHAAREGTRYASVRGFYSTSPATSDSIRQYVKQQAIGIKSSDVTVSTSWLPDNKPGSSVKVTVSCSVTPITNLIIKNALTLRSSSQMMIAP